MIEVTALSAGYGGRDVIQNISFRADRGEHLCILGTNGCGKSTLLKSLARIIAYRGAVKLDAQDISAFSRKELAKRIALLGQSAQICFPYTVWETVSLGRYAYSEGFLQKLSQEDTDSIADAIKKLDLWNLRDRLIDELSGGQLQRVFLAKTIAQNPDLILLDEPTNHLDLKNQIELLTYLKVWVRETNKMLIGVFHDLNLVYHFGDTALLMLDGRLAAWGGITQTLNRETLQNVYGIDVRGFMLKSLENWRRK